MNEYSQVPLAATLGRKWHSTTKINYFQNALPKMQGNLSIAARGFYNTK
jgi:membrane protease subunit (stomatin/prohibitin family)